MTGMIHGSQQGEVCPDCKQTTTPQDWTCPGCGYVLDRYLFRTVTPKTVAGLAKEAFWAGYQDCMTRWKATQSLELGEYRPSPGNETAYRAGWQHAVDKIEAKDERSRGRRRGLQLIGSGAMLSLIGGAMTYQAGLGWGALILGTGLINLVLGLVALLTGYSDACPPPLPGENAAGHSADSGLAVGGDRPVEQPFAAVTLPNAVTETVFLTWLVLGVNVAVFLAMVVSGVGLMQPTPDGLLRWGANFGPRTTAGEWWRLVTCTFVHVGMVHILFNMMVLRQIGPLMERLLGSAGFAVVYLVSGVAGSLASLFWNPYLVSAGASGAIFGLYGALLGFLAMRRAGLSPEMVGSLTKGAMVFVGFNLIFGLTTPNTDIAAHMGGLLGGFVCGLALSAVPRSENPGRRWSRLALVSAVASLALFAGARSLPHSVDVLAQLKHLAEFEKSTLATYTDATQRFRSRQISAAELASIINTQLIPQWMTEHDNLAKVKGLPAPQAKVIATLLQYMELRRDAWAAQAEGVQNGSLEKMRNAITKQREAADAMRRLSESMKKR